MIEYFIKVQLLLVPTLAIYFFLTSVIVCYGQSDVTDSIEYKNFFGGYPIAFFTPETRWGFGAAGVYTYFPGKQKSKRPSQWQVGAAYTLNKQILLFSFYNIFLEEDKHNLFGEISYYDYFYQYFGIGSNTLFEDEELYSANFPRVQINYLRKWKPKIFLGGYYHFDYYNISKIVEDGLLINSEIIGRDGSVISRLGLLARYDSRDQIFYPTEGSFATLDFAFNTETLGATSNYQALSFDLSQYYSIKRNIFAINFWTAKQFGDVPFQELLPLGGGKKARGIVKGRYREKTIVLFQGEYRFPIWKRFLGAAFLSYGNVGDSYKSLLSVNWKLNYGAGLRFVLDKENQSNIRIDVAGGSDEINFYFTVNEAF